MSRDSTSSGESGVGAAPHLLALMKRGDDAFNARNVAGMDAVHHPNMIAYVTGNAEPIYGRAAHAAAMKQFFSIFPDVHVHNDPYPIQFGSGDWITVVSRITGTFTGEMKLPNGKVVAPTGKAFDVEFAQTVKWDGDLLIERLVGLESGTATFGGARVPEQLCPGGQLLRWLSARTPSGAESPGRAVLHAGLATGERRCDRVARPRRRPA